MAAKTVLVPVDGSACSMRALEYAGEQQQACANVSVRVLYVQPPLPPSRFSSRPVP